VQASLGNPEDHVNVAMLHLAKGMFVIYGVLKRCHGWSTLVPFAALP
jgi:hypothetical protein